MLREEGKQLEKEGLQPKKESLVAQINRSSKTEAVTQEEEYPTKEVEVEVEGEAENLPFVAISATNWVTGPLNAQKV